MATEVVLSPKRNVMDFFKTPTKVSDASSSSKKSQGILGFFTSTPRTPKSSVSSTSTPSSAKLKKMSTSYDTDVQVIETVPEKEKQYSIKLSLDAKSDMCSGQSKSMQVESTEKPSTGSSSNKQKSKLKTNKPGKKKTNFEQSAVETTCSTDSQEKVDSKESFAEKDEDAVHEQMDYEEFKRALLQGQSKQPATDRTVEIDEVSGMEIPDEGGEKVIVEKGKLAEKEPSPVDVADGDEKTYEKDKRGGEQTPNESKLADNSGNPDTDAEKRPVRTRTRRSMQPMIIPSPVLSPTSSKSSKKDDSDLSLHGRDILEMTYEEYLKSIGAFDRSDTSNNESASNTQHTLEVKTENAVASASSTPSLYNFFSKTTKSTKQDYKQEGSTKVTVSAVVHGEPTVNRAMAIRERAKNALRLNKAAALEKHTKDKEDEIEVLGSETIIVDKSNEQTPVKTKQHKAEDECPGLTSAFTSNLKNTQDGFSTAVQEENSLSTCSSVLTPDKIAKKTQATLQFRKGGGLEMSAPVAKPSVSNVETPTGCSEDDTPVKTCKATLKKPTKRQRITEDDSDSSCAEIKASPAKGTPAVKAQQKTKLRAVGRRSLESDSGNEAKEFTPRSKRASTAAQARAQELLMKARQQADLYKAGKGHQHRKSSSSLSKKQASAITPAVTPKPSPSSAKQPKPEESKQSPAASKQKLEEEESASISPGSRRQSSRLAQQQREQRTYIDLDLESESDDSSSQPTKKKKTKRKDSDCCTPEKAPKKSPKKAAGKLAPIFTKLKGSEAEEQAPPRPPEDPELVRKRREFLMSGVPTELKRQAETAAAHTLVASEYAPFPVVSHVQQREPVTSGGVDVWSLTTEKRLKLHDDLLAVDVPSVNLEWKSLQWECVLGQKGDSACREPIQCDRDAISVEQRELLLRELQQTDPGFAFAALYDKFKARFDGAGQGGKDISQAETQGPQLTKQQSLEDSDVVVVDEKEETTLGPSDKVLSSGCQWTETLQPTRVSEIVGNTVVLKRLRNWLEEWKALIQKEARHTARIAANISDFETSDSEGEDSNQLCNTVLFVGPHGVGKTSAVYALAQQLSYKVFEVNAASSRQGRHILAQLQEATQSHQVAQKKDGVLPTILPAGLMSSKITDAAPGEKEPKNAVSLVPNAFANFFKKGTVGAETGKKAAARESPKKDGARKKKRPLELDSDASQSPKKLRKIKGKGAKPQSSQDAADSTLAGCLNLTSTSLILFDEVDLVFEEDTGFLQTVQHFINTTKIPIIMTTTDPTFGRAINAKFEQLIFKAPKLESVTRHLQTVLLAAGLRTCPEDVKALATTCRGDLRQALLTVQFFALSGGGANTEPRPLLQKPSRKENSGNEASSFLSASSAIELTTCSVASSVADGADSEDDFEFISLRTARKPQRRIIDEDDSKDAVNTDSVSERGTGGVTGKSGDEEVNASALPPVHMHLYKSVLGVSHDLQSLLVKCLREPFSQSSVTLLVNECLKLKTFNLDILLPNLLPLLPLPKVRMPDKWQPPSIPAATTNRKRIRIADLWDSEASDEDGQKSVSRFQLTELRGSQSASLENADAVMTRERVESDSVDTDGGRVDVKQENKAQVDVKSETVKISVKTDAVDTMTQSATVHAIDQKNVDTEDPTSQCKSTPQVLNYSGRNQLDRRGSGLSSKLLSDFAHFYETLSAVDTFAPSSNSHGDFGLDRFVLLPGIQDSAPHRHVEESESELGTEIGVEGKVYAARHLWQTVDMDAKAWREKNRGDTLPDGCCIPLLEENAPVSLMLQPGAEDIGVPERYQSVMNTVVSNLPLSCYHGLRSVSLQYLPTLRAITQAEHNRQVAKTKRRFHHYFDNIGLCLNKPTMTALCDEFPTGQDNSN